MKLILKYPAILLVKYLQRKYKSISIKNRYNYTNQVLFILRLIQSILYYFDGQFRAHGYFHPDCTWSEKDEKFYRKLFPQKDFEELDLVIWHNPKAITYYHNKIWKLSNHEHTDYASEIRKQLKIWNDWN